MKVGGQLFIYQEGSNNNGSLYIGQPQNIYRSLTTCMSLFPSLLRSFCYGSQKYERESLLTPAFDDRKWQPHLNAKARLILLDWLKEVAMEFNLVRHTFHLAVNYIDRFLSEVAQLPLYVFVFSLIYC